MAEPEPVRSGEFRLDRRRAIELLSRYQLASPYLFPLPWVRAAVACGASAVEALDGRDRFELRFEGLPFAPGELGEPLASLPAEKSEPRLQELGRGALCAFGAGVDHVFVRAGPAGARHALKLTRDGESLEPVVEAETRVVIGASWGPGGRPAAFDAGLAALDREVLAGILRFTDGSVAQGGLPEGSWEAFQIDGARGWLAPGRRARPSELFLYKLGVSCGSELAELPGPQVRAVAIDDGLELSLSQNAVVKEGRFASLVARLGAAAEAFALGKARAVSRILPAIGGWLRDPEAYSRWRADIAGGERSGAGIVLEAQRFFALDAGLADDRRALLDYWAPVVGWLRDSALRVLGDGRPRKTDLERALWAAPLYLSVEGLPLTLDELESQRLRFRRLTVGERKFSGEERLPPTLAVDSRRRMLELLAGPAGDRLT